MSALSELLEPYVEQVEAAMRDTVPPLGRHDFMRLLHYHLGWSTIEGEPSDRPSGKRVRSALCLMLGEALGATRPQLMPAAVAVELLHEFSLIHDDIEDGDRTRRHQPTLWTLVGQPQAINAGDGLFAIAQQALLVCAEQGVPAGRVLEAQRRFNETAVQLCIGQFLDMGFERRDAVTPDEYIEMIGGKTGALIAFAGEVAALLAGADEPTIAAARAYSEAMGLAFQMHDDILGIWGDPEATGKPVGADIRAKKKSLPVAYALSQQQSDRLRALYAADLADEAQVKEARDLIVAAGGREFTQRHAAQQEQRARDALAQLPIPTERRAPLTLLLDLLAGRGH